MSSIEVAPPLPDSMINILEQIDKNLEKRSKSYVDDSHVFARVVVNLYSRLLKIQEASTLQEAKEFARVDI